MTWIVRRYYVRSGDRPNHWYSTQVIQNTDDGQEDIGNSIPFRTKKTAQAWADMKNEDLVTEGTYRIGI